MTERTVTHATIHLERRFDASAARVFAAWTTPEARDRWFVNGEGWIVAEYRHDVRAGGHEHGRFRREDTPMITNDTRYYEIVPDRRIVFAYAMGVEGQPPFSVSLATVEIEPDGSGAKLKLTEQGAFLDGADQAKNRETGWGWLMDALERELARETEAA